MKSTITIMIIILINLTTLSLQAADDAPEPEQPINIQTLTLDNAIDYALKHSPQIKEAEIVIALSEIDLAKTKWWNWFVR
jgi:outer membrane protein TolC